MASADLARSNKWLVVAAVAPGLIAAAGVILYHHQHLTIEPSQVTLPSDGC